MTAAQEADPKVLIELAERILNGSEGMARVPPARAACWIARRALEAIIVKLLLRKKLATGRSSTRSKLTCLSVAYNDDPSLATTLATLWDQFSRYCHHHAYELTPTVSETRYLIDRLAAVVDQRLATPDARSRDLV